MNIAHISDLHLTDSTHKNKYSIDTRTHLQRVLTHIKQQAACVDLVVVTGDIADDKHPESYQSLRDSLVGFPLPYYLIPGNHDSRAVMAQFFPELQAALKETGGFIQYVVEDYSVRLIGLDTVIPDSGKGMLCEQRLAWLKLQLQKELEKPVVLFMHHPPFKSGLVKMDKFAYLIDKEPFHALLLQHPQIKLVLCGHLHRSVHTQLAGIPVRAAPSTAFAHTLQLMDSQPREQLAESPKYDLHCFREGTFVSHSVSLEVS